MRLVRREGLTLTRRRQTVLLDCPGTLTLSERLVGPPVIQIVHRLRCSKSSTNSSQVARISWPSATRRSRPKVPAEVAPRRRRERARFVVLCLPTGAVEPAARELPPPSGRRRLAAISASACQCPREDALGHCSHRIPPGAIGVCWADHEVSFYPPPASRRRTLPSVVPRRSNLRPAVRRLRPSRPLHCAISTAQRIRY